MLFACVALICGTWLLSLLLLIRFGMPKFTKEVHRYEHPPTLGPDASNPVIAEDDDALQDQLRKQALFSDLATAVNQFISGEDV